METADPQAKPGGSPARKTCGAKLRKKPGKRCKSTKLMPNGRCRLHGGKTPEGPASPNWQHGGRSKHRWMADLPADQIQLGDRFNKALADPTLMGLRASIALNDAMITSYLNSLKVSGKALSHAQQKRVHELLDMQRKLAADEARRMRDLGAVVGQVQFWAVINTCIRLFNTFVTEADRREVHRQLQQALRGATTKPADIVDAETSEGGVDGDSGTD